MIAVSFLLSALLATSAIASPVHYADVSRTSVDLQSPDYVNPHFTLTVNRVDDLVAPSGDIVAERRTAVQLSFDIGVASEDGGEPDLTLNGVPLKAGLANAVVSVKAALGFDPEATGVIKADGSGIDRAAAQDLADSFDVGLVKVQVSVVAEKGLLRSSDDPVLPDIPALRFTLLERVLEVNGKSVSEAEVGEHVFFVTPVGRFLPVQSGAQWAHITDNAEEEDNVDDVSIQGSDRLLLSDDSEPSSAGCTSAKFGHRFINWFKHLSPVLRFLVLFSWVSLSLATLYLLGVVLVTALWRRRRTTDGYSRPDLEYAASGGKLDTSSSTLVSPPHYNTLDEKRVLQDADAKTVDDAEGDVRAEAKLPGDGDRENDRLCK